MDDSEYLQFHATQVLRLAVALVAITLVSIRIRRHLIRRHFARSHGCQPVVRSHSKDPFLGLDAVCAIIRAAREHKNLETACERHRVYGDTFTSRLLTNRVISTVEPENIKTILSLNFKDYGIGHRLGFFEPLLGKGIFDTDGDDWAASRALIRPSFTRDQVADLTLFEHLMPDLFALIPRDGATVVDLQDLFFRYTIDSATEFLFGQSVGSLRKTRSEPDFAKAFNYAQDAITMRGLLGPFKVLYRDPEADECNRICRDFAQQFVEEALHTVQSETEEKQRETKPRRYIFSHALAKRTSDKRRILDELMNVLLAGRDTTAGLLSNMFFMLAKHPTIWAKLRKEVASLDGRLPTYKELRNLKYLKCCINECEEETCQFRYFAIAKSFTSAASASSRTTERARGATRHSHPGRRRRGRTLTGLRPQGYISRL